MELTPLQAALWMLLQCIDWRMDKEFTHSKIMGWTDADTKEEFFGFKAVDVARLHGHKQGVGKGIFFRLHDDRVFDGMARPHEPDRALYDATTH